MSFLLITGEEATKAVKVRFFLGEEMIADGFVTLEQWDRMREDLNDILEEDNPIWVVSRGEYEFAHG